MNYKFVFKTATLILSLLTGMHAQAECFGGDNGEWICEEQQPQPTTQGNGASGSGLRLPATSSRQPDGTFVPAVDYSLGTGRRLGPAVGTTQQSGSNQPVNSPAAAAALAAQCETDADEAKAYCEDPISYSSEGDLAGSAEAAGVANNVLTLGTMYNAMTGGSSSTICNIMSTGGAAALGLNTTFATRCGSFVSGCKTSCANAENSILSMSELDAKKVKAKMRLCTAQSRRVAEMSSAASQSFTSAMMGRACKQAASSNNFNTSGVGVPPEMPAVGTDCATDPNNPLCQNGGAGGSGAGTGYASGQGSMDGKDSSDFNVSAAEGGDPSQGGNPGGAAGDTAKNGGVANGGGSMLGGGGGSGGGGGDEKGGRAAGGGYKTDILQGERAGGGYNAGGGAATAGGGWSGYGGGPEEQTRRGNGLDLRQFLPGGQKDGQVRGPAGLNRANAEVAPMHEDIFKKISQRVSVVCKTNRLKDCQ